MMNNFDKSEYYRKYVIGLRFKELIGYTVWGTDMEDNENDKLLVKNKKLVLFAKLENIEEQIKKIDSPYLDDSNFKKWLNEESFKNAYTINNFDTFLEFNQKSLSDKSTSLEILNCINLIQDFSIQTNLTTINNLLNNKDIIAIKDHIYNNYFWKGDENQDNIKVDVKNVLQKLYNLFYSYVEII